MAEKTKALASEQNDAVRALAQKLVKDDFGDNKSAAARAFNVSQSMLYEFLATPPRRGAGVRLLHGISAYLGWSLDEVIRGRKSESDTIKTVVPAHLEEDDETRRTIEYAVEVLGVSQEAVDRVTSTLARGAQRIEPGDLLDDLRSEDRKIKREAQLGAEEARRQRGERPVGDELDPPLDLEAIKAKRKRNGKK